MGILLGGRSPGSTPWTVSDRSGRKWIWRARVHRVYGLGLKLGKLLAGDYLHPVTIGVALTPVRRYGPRMSHPAAATHNKVIGYLFWFFGFTGAHRFYYGKPLSGVIWLFTAGLLGIGWIIDAFLIPGMDDEANRRYTSGSYDYSVAWLLLAFLGLFGIHRMYLGKIGTGILWLFTGGLCGIGFLYDFCTLNSQIDQRNYNSRYRFP